MTVVVLSTLVALLGLATLLGFVGTWWLFEIASNLRVQLAVLLVVAGLVLLALGARRWAMVAVVALVLNLAVVVPSLIGSPTPAPPGAPTLDITFANVKIRAADQQEVLAYLRKRDDDLVIIAAGTRSWVDAFERHLRGLYVVEGPRRGQDLEVIVLARDPATQAVVHKPEDYSRSALVEVTVALGDEVVQVLGTHPVSPVTPGRAMRRDRHLDWIAEWARDQDGPAVVVGDLNVSPWSPRFRSLVSTGGLVDSRRGYGLQASWPAPLGPFGVPLDHVLHTDELTTVARELGPSFGSDHRMVHARLGPAAAS